MDNSQDNFSTPKSVSNLERRIAEADKKAAEALARLKQLKARQTQIEAQQKALESKKRRAEENQRKYEVGGLAALAGLLHCDRGQLLGGLLMVADRLNNSPDWARQVKARGDALLADREQARKAKADRSQDTAHVSDIGLRNPNPKEGQA